jgi:hypothetical protein
MGPATVSRDDPLLAGTVGAQLIVRVAARAIFPNCPRYIPKMELIKPSIYAPRAGCDAPEPAWKEDFKGYVHPRQPTGICGQSISSWINRVSIVSTGSPKTAKRPSQQRSDWQSRKDITGCTKMLQAKSAISQGVVFCPALVWAVNVVGRAASDISGTVFYELQGRSPSHRLTTSRSVANSDRPATVDALSTPSLQSAVAIRSLAGTTLSILAVDRRCTSGAVLRPCSTQVGPIHGVGGSGRRFPV